jgi:D-alanine-D-alanine ligase
MSPFRSRMDPTSRTGPSKVVLEEADMAYVGPAVMGSAAAMDTDVAKRLMRSAGLPIVPFLVVTTAQPVEYYEVTSALGRPSCS